MKALASAAFVLAMLASGGRASAQPLVPQPWSNPATWGGRVPAAGEHVTIPGGRRVVLDITPPPLASLVIDGTLAFAEADVNLTVGWIMVHGVLEVGTEEDPFEHRSTITLTGPLSDDIMGMGARFIGAMGGGQIQIHGARRSSVDWAVLDADVQPGATAITVANIEHAKQALPLDWRPGDMLAIAASGRDPLQAEAVTVTAVDGGRVTFSPPPRFPHLGGMRTIAGRPVDMRAEVALLSRNVVIQGASDGYSQQLGGHIMSMASTVMKIEGTELRFMGQAGRKGRYPIHWHLAGVVPGDYSRFNSIWNSFHRGVVIHGTARVEMRGNVAANVASHTFVVAEDGNEEGNVVEDNVGILTTRLPDARFVFLGPDQPGSTGPGAQDEWRPATFWINNPRNTIRYNRAAGGVGASGFFFDDPHGRMGPTPMFPPAQFPEIFDENVAHSYLATDIADRNPLRTAGYGLIVRMPVRAGGTSFDGFTAYQNSIAGAWLEQQGERLQSPTLVDNASGAVLFRSTLSGGLVVGATPWAVTPHPAAARRGGVQVIGLFGGGKAPRVQQTTFVDQQPAAVFVESDHLQAGNLFEGITRVGTPIPVSLRDRSFDHAWDGALVDADGSLTGTGVPTLVSGAPISSESVFRAGWGTYAPGGAYSSPRPVEAASGPTGLTAYVEGTTVGLAWVAPATGSVTGYLLEAGTAPGLTNVALPLGLAPAATIPGAPAGTFHLRVRGAGPGGLTTASNEVRVTIGTPQCLLPEAPGGLAGSVTQRIVSLSWLPASADPVVYELVVGSAPARSDIATIPLGAAPSLHAAAPPGAYHVRVVARSACGVSLPSNEIVVVVP